MEEMNGSMAGFGIMAHGVDQMLADKRSATSYRREKSLMNKQYEMNMAATKAAPSMQVEGLRMAGFNPAMVAGAGSSPAPTVSKGTADMAQTIPFDAASIAQLQLIGAQADKLEAETELIRSQKNTEDERPENIHADTVLKREQRDLEFAKRLNTDADTERVKAEAKRIGNVNKVFEDQNEALAGYGKAMAEKWKNSKWFEGLSPDSKETINAIADGTLPLSVGGMAALMDTIKSQKDLSDADRTQVANAFENAITSRQFLDKEVMDAKTKMDLAKYNLTNKQKDHLQKQIEYLQEQIPYIADQMVAETNKLISDRRNLDAQEFGHELDNTMKRMLNQSFNATDPGKQLNDGRILGYLGAMAHKALEGIVGMLGMIYAFGKGKNVLEHLGDKRTEKTKKVTTYPDIEQSPLFDQYNQRIPGTGGRSSYQRTVEHAPGFPQE